MEPRFRLPAPYLGHLGVRPHARTLWGQPFRMWGRLRGSLWFGRVRVKTNHLKPLGRWGGAFSQCPFGELCSVGWKEVKGDLGASCLVGWV